MLLNSLFVGLGGFLGSMARYFVYVLVSVNAPGKFPLATLVVNLFGCFCMGLLSSMIEKQYSISHEHLLFLSVGVLGGFTTFSAFGMETVSLIRSNQITLAAVNIVANLGLGLLAVFLGSQLARA